MTPAPAPSSAPPPFESTGAFPFADARDRARAAAVVAGILAEHAVVALDAADPRVCLPRRLTPRTTNLPAELASAVPGATFTADAVALLVTETAIQWAASGPLAADLRAAAWPASGP